MNYLQLCRRCMTLVLPIAVVAWSETSLARHATITSTVLTSGSSTAGAGFVETAAIKPDPNRAVFAAIESGTSVAAAPTASGNGLTWVQVASISFAGNARRLTVFRAMHASPTEGRIRFTFPQAQTSFAWSVIQLDGVDTTGTAASGATVQTVTNAVTGATTIAANLAPRRNENNVMLGFVALNQNTNVRPDGDFIELTDSAIGSPALRLESETAVNQTTCTPTFANAAAAIVAIEVQSGGVIDLATKWTRHTIVAGSEAFKGADGVDLAVIGEGQVAVVSGHEQSNTVTVSLQPKIPPQDGSDWPKVVLPLKSTGAGPEDAVFADVDRDGLLDVIVGAEGGQRVVVLFAPVKLGDEGWQDASKWMRMDLGPKVMRVMRVAFANVTGTPWPEIVVGGKKSGSAKTATIGYYTLTTPSSPRSAGSWTYTAIRVQGSAIREVGWVMQMFVQDLDGDGDNDIVYTDREKLINGDTSAMGLRWLQNPGDDSPIWTEHQISLPREANHKWFDIGNWDGDNDLDLTDCRSPSTLDEISLWRNDGDWLSWTNVAIPRRSQSFVGECHHITFVNVDNAGAPDVAITYSNAGNPNSGVIWLHNAGTQAAPVWERGEISGNAVGDGVKFDNLIWYDIDGDGDLDAITSEQNEPMTDGPGPGLGVIWYENPVNP